MEQKISVQAWTQAAHRHVNVFLIYFEIALQFYEIKQSFQHT